MHLKFRELFSDKKIVDRLVELLILNEGQPTVTKFGNVRVDATLTFGRVGLTIQEALDLHGIMNYIQGMGFVIGGELEVFQFLQRECEKKISGSLVYLPSNGEVGMYGT